MSDPMICPSCNTRHAFSGCLLALADRLAAVEARLPVVAPVIQCNGRRCACVEPTSKDFCAPCWAAECYKDWPGEPCRRPATPPSAEPTTGNAPVLANSPVCQPNAPLSTSPAFVNQPAPVASGASVPDGCDCEFKDAGDCADQWRDNPNHPDEPSDERCLCACHGAGVLDVQACPKCGGEVNHGYGLMGGGMGPYVFCAEDRCDFFAKAQDSVASVPDFGMLGRVCKVTGVYVSRCEHCGAEPLNATIVEPPKAETEDVDWSRFIPTEEIPESRDADGYVAGDVYASIGPRGHRSVRLFVNATSSHTLAARDGEFTSSRERVRLIRHADGRWADGFNPSGPCAPFCGKAFGSIPEPGAWHIGKHGRWCCSFFCAERARDAPKAETAQAAEAPEHPPTCYAVMRPHYACNCQVGTDPPHWCVCPCCRRRVVEPHADACEKCKQADHAKPCHSEQPAEPGAPVGQGFCQTCIATVPVDSADRCTKCYPAAPPVAACLYPEKCGKRWLRNSVLYDGDDGSPPWRCPNCKAPPVAAKLSEEQLQASVAWARQWLRTAGCTPSEYRAFTATVMLADSAAELKQLYGAAMSDLGAVQKAGEQWCKIAEQRLQDIAALETALDAATAENETLRKQLETRDARIAGLEASHREDVEKAVREERERVDGWWKAWDRSALFAFTGVKRDAGIASGDPVPKVGG